MPIISEASIGLKTPAKCAFFSNVKSFDRSLGLLINLLVVTYLYNPCTFKYLIKTLLASFFSLYCNGGANKDRGTNQTMTCI